MSDVATTVTRHDGEKLTLAEITDSWSVVKRTGEQQKFDYNKIIQAVSRCFTNQLELPLSESVETAKVIAAGTVNLLAGGEESSFSIETVQDAVIRTLWVNGQYEAATQYTLYREMRRQERVNKPIDANLERLFAKDAEILRTPAQMYQFVSKFARWKEEDKRRETWSEAIDRVFNWFETLPHYAKLAEEEKTWLKTMMFEMKATSSLRVLQMAGPALERCHMGVYNCLGRETAFVTREGVKTFEDFTDGDQVEVLSHTGSWRNAVIRNYGMQTLRTRVIRRGNSECRVRTTDSHRWIRKDGTVTDDLRVGDTLHQPPCPAGGWDYDDAEPDEKLFWAYGFVYGDGTLVKRAGKYTSSMVRLCGDKSRFLERFEELGFSHSFPPSHEGDPTVYTGRYLKVLPDLSTDGLRKVLAFVRGWLDADGNKQVGQGNVNEYASIQVTGEEGINFVRRVFPTVGVYITREDEIVTETNYGTRSATTVRFGLVNRFGSAPNSYHSLREILADDSVEEVWCLEVEEDRSFVLPCGVVTGNCAGLPIVDLFAFAELLYILMQGSGCGFSVESDFVTRLPRVRKQKKGKAEVYVIEDTTEGWCDALHTGLKTWFGGYDVTYDVTKLRLKGTRLKTKGGLASGPEPLLELLAFVRKTILAAQSRRLTDLECHDICCKIAKIVQVGGVRRASTISLSDLHSESMRRAKHGDWYVDNQQRAMANNSSVYEKRPDIYTFMSEFKALVDSRSGERGIFNRGAARRLRPARRKNARFIVNPCAEIVFRPFGLCNLSIAVAREDDTVETLIEKVRAAAYFGKIQSLCTNFNYVRPAWKKNAEEELLLGVDVTGHADCPLLRFGAPNRAELLRKLRETVAEVDASLSPRFGCGLSAANTTIKPAGDSSELFACASGASPRFGAQQIRRFRESKISPVANFLIASGVPHETAMEDDGLWAFSFPKKAPVGSTLREDMSAADQIHNWLEWKGNYAEHSVSVTVYVKDHEWPEVQSLVWKHFDEITCLSFLPWDNGSYRTVPNEVLTIEEYEKFAATFPELHWAKLSQYEVEDSTYMNRAMACKGDNCEL